MQHHVDIAEVQAHLVELLKAATPGDEILITQNGEEVGKLLPLASIAASSKPPRPDPGLAKGRVHMTDDFNDSFTDYSDTIP